MTAATTLMVTNERKNTKAAAPTCEVKPIIKQHIVIVPEVVINPVKKVRKPRTKKPNADIDIATLLTPKRKRPEIPAVVVPQNIVPVIPYRDDSYASRLYAAAEEQYAIEAREAREKAELLTLPKIIKPKKKKKKNIDEIIVDFIQDII